MGEAFEAAERAGAGIAGETIITLGNDDLVHCDRRGGVRHHAVRPVPVVSVHGAGDVFMGALSVRLAAPAAMEDAIASGQAAAARIVSTPLGERGISFTLGDELSRGHVRRDRKILSRTSAPIFRGAERAPRDRHFRAADVTGLRASLVPAKDVSVAGAP